MRKPLLAILLVAVLAIGLGLVSTLSSGRTGTGNGPSWILNDLAKGQRIARAENKPILLYFGAGW